MLTVSLPQAIQSHRAAMAVLRQQRGFVKHLLDAGMVDEHEAEVRGGLMPGCGARLHDRGGAGSDGRSGLKSDATHALHSPFAAPVPACTT